MALSEELKEVYSSNPTAVESYDTVEISHSLFTQTYYMVRHQDPLVVELEDASPVTFIPFPFDIQLPEVGSSQQDISFVFSNVGQEGVTELELAAEAIDEPIKLTYRVYIDGYLEPQTSPLVLNLTNIVADVTAITAVASRPDLFKRQVPSGNLSYFDSRFPGLWL